MKLYFKQPITDRAKLKFLEWLTDDICNKGYLISETYNKAIKDGFVNYNDPINIKELKALDIWQEPEPDYNEWIGEDCVFSDHPIGTDNDSLYLSILDSITDYNSFRMINGNTYSYCMLKSDYVKLLKEQSK